MYKYFLIDLDRTLWDFNKNSEMAIHHLIDKYPIIGEHINYDKHFFFQQYDAINHKLWSDYEAGKLAKHELRWKRFYDSFLEFGLDDKELAATFGEEYIHQMSLEKELIPGTIELLELIQENNGKMAIISNGFKEAQRGKLETSGIANYFQEVIISEEVGAHKPSPKIFQIALEKLSGVSQKENPELWIEVKKQTLMIGDDIANDIEGAQIFGIDQYYLNSNDDHSLSGATYQGNTLSTLIIILSKLLSPNIIGTDRETNS